MSIWNAIVDAIVMKIFRGVEPTESALKNFKKNFNVLNDFIGNNKYVAGNELTIADLSYLATISTLAINDYKDLDEFPNVKNWFFRVQKELPYFDDVNGKVPELWKQHSSANK
ncbi:unnamed protein product [Oppiella nova]|uniref:GST C-terminal domain-containing protein n=1 Tax=Oppiella nova TaxID=334625 RepID=A0A7R9R131_9ACAR|nr:unnamed protein product [Oppiella nova]CAG2181654.1 unnamed protein product [Oppiella nova]